MYAIPSQCNKNNQEITRKLLKSLKKEKKMWEMSFLNYKQRHNREGQQS